MRSYGSILILGLLLTACTSTPFREDVALNETKQIEQNFYEYLSWTGMDIGKQESIDIGFNTRQDPLEDVEPITADTLGRCRHWASAVILNAEKWTELSALEKELVLFHELGHCALGKLHSSLDSCVETQNLMCPKKAQIMMDYRMNRSTYLRKFFNLPSSISDQEIESLRYQSLEE